MKKVNINNTWNFRYDDAGDFANFIPPSEGGTEITLPHDFIIGKQRDPNVPGKYRTGYYPGAAGIYTRYLDMEKGDEDRKFILEIDGSYMNTIVMLNSDIVQKHPYGYTAFHADLTKYMKPGKKNKLSVYVNNCFLPNSRWYTGGGLYRDVNLLVSEKIYFIPWTLFVKTNYISDKSASIFVEAVVKNESYSDFQGYCHFHISYDGMAVAEVSLCAEIKAGKTHTFCTDIEVPNPQLWDLDTPNLYQAAAVLQENGREIDTDQTRFGIRTVSADAQKGLFLNSRPLKLKGGCVHHDCGILGAAAFRDYEYRKVKIHKENGFNAIRCAHNPPSAHFLDACDRYGILVIDEAFDSWRMGKTLNDYSLFFEEWWERDMTAMIQRDRNHPSVIMWSIGNEIGERSGDSDGYEWAKKISNYVRQLDSSRLITSGICAIWPTQEQEEEFLKSEVDKTYDSCAGTPQKESAERIHEVNLDTPFSQKYWGAYTERYAEALDVVGYNYMENRYQSDGLCYPDRVICGMESFAGSIDRIWELTEQFPYVIGDFAWTSYDYIGEAGIGKALYFESGAKLPEHEIAHDSDYPWCLAHTSDFDICGFPTPQAAYRRIVWGSGETFIAVHNPENYKKEEVLSLWGWPDCDNHFTYPEYIGRPIEATIYSKAEEVELFHNGKSLGRKKTERFRAKYELVYEPGELKAVSYEGEGVLSYSSIRTAGKPYRLRITPEPMDLRVPDQRLIFAVIEIVDKNGNLVPVNHKAVKASVTGRLALKAFGNGDPRTEGNYTKGEFPSYRGKFLAIVQTETDEKGTSDTEGDDSENILRVTSEGLIPGELRVPHTACIIGSI